MMLVILLCWIGLGICLVLFGKLCNNQWLLGVGVVMVLAAAMIDKVNW